VGPELGERTTACFRGRPIEREDAVEMIELMLDHACLEPRRFDPERLADRADSLDGESGRALDRHDDGGGSEREAALVGAFALVIGRDDSRIDEHVGRSVLRRLVDEHALEDPDLRCREADAARLAHQVSHPVDELLQNLVELGHLLGGHSKDWIGVLANLRQGDTPTRVALWIELLVANLTLDLAHAGQCTGRLRS
jgi:hypothetical protein